MFHAPALVGQPGITLAAPLKQLAGLAMQFCTTLHGCSALPAALRKRAGICIPASSTSRTHSSPCSHALKIAYQNCSLKCF